MVLNVCRRVLRCEQDAEDAFQATFLVLARRAARLEWRPSVGGWLHTVALQTALRARARAARTRCEETLEKEPMSEARAQPTWDDVKPVLDEELARLSAKYRLPVVLCYLEGLSNDEAARQLGWPTGTVKTWLSRARDLLRGRLVRRGVTLSAAALGNLLETHAASAATSRVLFEATLQLVTSGQANPIAGQQLVEGVLNTMYFAKLRMVVASVALAAGVFALGAWGLNMSGRVSESGPVRVAALVVVPVDEYPGLRRRSWR